MQTSGLSSVNRQAPRLRLEVACRLLRAEHLARPPSHGHSILRVRDFWKRREWHDYSAGCAARLWISSSNTSNRRHQVDRLPRRQAQRFQADRQRYHKESWWKHPQSLSRALALDEPSVAPDPGTNGCSGSCGPRHDLRPHIIPSSRPNADSHNQCECQVLLQRPINAAPRMRHPACSSVMAPQNPSGSWRGIQLLQRRSWTETLKAS